MTHVSGFERQIGEMKPLSPVECDPGALSLHACGMYTISLVQNDARGTDDSECTGSPLGLLQVCI